MNIALLILDYPSTTGTGSSAMLTARKAWGQFFPGTWDLSEAIHLDTITRLVDIHLGIRKLAREQAFILCYCHYDNSIFPSLFSLAKEFSHHGVCVFAVVVSDGGISSEVERSLATKIRDVQNLFLVASKLDFPSWARRTNPAIAAYFESDVVARLPAISGRHEVPDRAAAFYRLFRLYEEKVTSARARRTNRIPAAILDAAPALPAPTYCVQLFLALKILRTEGWRNVGPDFHAAKRKIMDAVPRDTFSDNHPVSRAIQQCRRADDGSPPPSTMVVDAALAALRRLP